MCRLRLESKLNRLKSENKKALITYITAGDPDLNTTIEVIKTMEEAGVDVVEIGIPYSDPLADGPTIQEASTRALKSGTNLNGIFSMIGQVRPQIRIPLVIMTYINPILQFGVERFCEEAAKVGVDGLIIPDLPFEEKSLIEEFVRKYDLALVPLLAPTTPRERIKTLCEKAQGFVYCVSLTGVTGVTSKTADNIKEFLNNTKEFSPVPVAVGFGISTPEQAKNLSIQADGIIIGSAIINLLQQKGTASSGLAALREYLREVKEAMQPVEVEEVLGDEAIQTSG